MAVRSAHMGCAGLSVNYYYRLMTSGLKLVGLFHFRKAEIVQSWARLADLTDGPRIHCHLWAFCSSSAAAETGRSGSLHSNSEAGWFMPNSQKKKKTWSMPGQLAARRFKALGPCGRRALQFVKRHVPNAADLARRRTVTAPLFLPDPLFHP